LQRFWEQEEIVSPICTKEEEAVERHYVEINHQGRNMAIRSETLSFTKSSTWTFLHYGRIQISAIGKKLTRNLELRREYIKFMDEYLSLGLMQLVPEDDSSYDNISDKLIFFLSHHAVFKESSMTTKRWFFYAFDKSAKGISLNDMLKVGLTI
jgi:hypothetical protein